MFSLSIIYLGKTRKLLNQNLLLYLDINIINEDSNHIQVLLLQYLHIIFTAVDNIFIGKSTK
jgi:hypothetical protein